MGTATFVSSVRNETIQTFRYTHATILAAGTAADIILGVPRKAQLLGIGITCPTSVDFDILLTQKTSITFPSNDIVVYAIDQVQQYKELFNPPIPYSNKETTEASALYLTIINTDAAHATGVITIDLIVKFER
jgi:hypothetical protein